MKHRTLRGMTALTLGAALLLSACGDDAEPDATASPSADASATPEATVTTPPTAEDVAALDAVTYTGAGSKPTIGFTAPFSVSADVARVVTEGTGGAVEGTDVWVHTVTFNGATGEEVNTSWATQPELLDLSVAPADHPLSVALTGRAIGSQIFFASADTQAAGGSPTALTAIEIVAPLPALTADTGMPTVTFDDAGKPALAVTPGFAGPADLITEVLTEGDGAVVETGQSVTVNYTGWLQADGTQFDSSWDSGTPFETVIGTGEVIPGWDEAIVGQKVGSTLLLVIPSDLGYGDRGSQTIPPGATLVFVVEIIDAA